MKIKFLMCGILVLLNIACFSEAAPSKKKGPIFYSIDSAVAEISPDDVGNHRQLNIQPPSALYHWISIKSLNRLFQSQRNPNEMPLKLLGSDSYMSVLVNNVPVFKDVQGLYAWHNPVGASIGGSSEIYGNHEALLALRIDPSAKIGIVVTDDAQASRELQDPSLRKVYDLILHVNGSMLKGEFLPGYIEWVVVNPQIVTSYTADPKESIPVIEEYKSALKKLKKSAVKAGVAPIEVIAGAQHNANVAFATTPEFLEELEDKLVKNSSHLEKKFRSGWTSLRNTGSSCKAVFNHNN